MVMVTGAGPFKLSPPIPRPRPLRMREVITASSSVFPVRFMESRLPGSVGRIVP